jgi:hypothetical protein
MKARPRWCRQRGRSDDTWARNYREHPAEMRRATLWSCLPPTPLELTGGYLSATADAANTEGCSGAFTASLAHPRPRMS